MSPRTIKTSWIVALAVVVVFAVLLYYRLSTRKATEQAPQTTQGNVTTNTPPSSTFERPHATVSPVNPLVTILSPSAGDEWIVGTIHSITWNKAAARTGGIYLVNAGTHEIVGWITPNTGPEQVSYDWNTRDLLLSRTSPLIKDVVPGTYFVKIIFDGPIGGAQSAPFSIIYASQARVPVYTVTIQNLTFSPKTLIVNQGDKVMFINNDTVTHTVRVAAFSIATLAPGESFTFGTSSLSPAPYHVYSESYPAAAFTLTVQ